MTTACTYSISYAESLRKPCMTPAEFLAAVEGELRLQGGAFDRAELV